MPVYHGTDEDSAQSIVVQGLDQQAWQTAAGGAGPDPKGFSVTVSLQDARRLGRGGVRWNAWEMPTGDWFSRPIPMHCLCRSDNQDSGRILANASYDRRTSRESAPVYSQWFREVHG